MKRLLLVAVALFVFFFPGASQGSDITLNFDDLAGSGALPAGYGGLTWDSYWGYTDSSSGYSPSSGTEAIYTHNFGGWINFSDYIALGKYVTFLGSWVASADAGQEMYWEGYRAGVEVFESVHLYGEVSEFISVEWAGIDKVQFVSTSFDFFIVDDFQFRLEDASPAVPIPSTILLLGTGFVAVAGLSRKFNRS